MIDNKDLKYMGAAIVPLESFLRNLPLGLCLEDRLRLDAIVLSTDIIVRAYSDLQAVSVEVGKKVKQFQAENMAVVIGASWTIIDQLHACRQLLFQASRNNPGPLMRQFLAVSERASKLRNQMDHLKDNLGNLSNPKRNLGPLFGTISYLYSGWNDDGECHNITVGMGAIREKMNIFRIDAGGKNVHRPVDHFTFTAFDLTIEFGPALAALELLLDHTASSISDQFRNHLEKLEQEDLSKTVNFSNAGTGIITVLETFSM